jgi:hypothetical protein
MVCCVELYCFILVACSTPRFVSGAWGTGCLIRHPVRHDDRPLSFPKKLQAAKAAAAIVSSLSSEPVIRIEQRFTGMYAVFERILLLEGATYM